MRVWRALNRRAGRTPQIDGDFVTFCCVNAEDLRIFVLAQCQDPARADAVVRETLLAARGVWPLVGNYPKPIGWLLKTARQKLPTPIGCDSADSGPTRLCPDVVTGSAISATAVDSGSALLRLVAELPREYAEICVLDWFQFSDPEISMVLELPGAAVIGHRAEARTRLQALIDADLDLAGSGLRER